MAESDGGIVSTIASNSITVIKTMEKDIADLVKTVNKGEMDMESIVNLQLSVQKWNIISQIGSAAMKAVTDAVRSVVQRM